MIDGLSPRLLIPDNTPLSLLSMMGKGALNWLFELGAEVWVTDMVRAEALRDPEPGADQRRDQRAALKEWFTENGNRIRIQQTREGADYQREMRNWDRGGRVAADKPSWRNRGEASLSELIPIAANLVASGETLVLLVDDRAARAMLLAAIQTHALNADIMATQTFIAILERDFGLVVAGNAWQTIRLAADGDVPVPYNPDPIVVRPGVP
jgi:hypothetical protein